MAKNVGQLRDLERELEQVNEKISQCRLEKELLEWEKTKVEENFGKMEGASGNLRNVGGMSETPRRPAMAMQPQYQDVDTEVRFQAPKTPNFHEETTGYASEADTVPLKRNATFAPLTPKQPVTYPFSSTPIDPHEIRGDANKQNSVDTRPRLMPVVMSQNMASEHVKRQRPLLVPDRYDGKSAWRDYHHHFQACKEVNGWQDEEAASYLMASLQGEALRCVSGLSREVRSSFEQLAKMLARRFDSSQQAENYLMELRYRKQGPRESLQELGQAIHELAIKAYPEIPAMSRERLEKNHYIDAVEGQSIREGIHRARPSNLDEAIQAALETENFEKVEMQRRNDRYRSGRYARGLDSDTDVRLQQMESMLSNQMQHMQILTELFHKMESSQANAGNTQPSPPPNTVNSGRPQRVEDRTCWRCGEVGHLSRQCSLPRRSKGQSGNGRQPVVGPEGRLEINQGQQNHPSQTEQRQ